MTSQSENVYDVIILGGGSAGLTAGIYTARHGLRTLLLEGSRLGGKASDAHRIDNFPGFSEGISGRELMERFIAQAERFGVEFKMESVVGLDILVDLKLVTTRNSVYHAKSIIVATGIQRRQLRVPGELEYKGRGVSYCSICDGPLFMDKIVAVVGPGREAVEETLKLAEVARKVYAIPGVKRYSHSTKTFQEMADKIEVIEDADIASIHGETFVTHINLKSSPPRTLEVDGVFVILDNIPITYIVREAGIKTNESGCILVNKDQQTNIDGVFAAGDCCCGGMQVVIAAGEGGQAGLSALRYIRSKR